MAARSATESTTNSSLPPFCKEPQEHSQNMAESDEEGAVGITTEPAAVVIPKLCRYYLRGHCAFGENCYYIHHNDSEGRRQQRRQPFRTHLRGNNRNFSNSNANTSQASTSSQNNNWTISQDRGIPTKTITNTLYQPKISNKDQQCPDLPRSVRDVEDQGDNVEGACSPPLRRPWVNAPEFVPKSSPKPRSYAAAVNPHSDDEEDPNNKLKLCPYAMKDGFCKYPPSECSYVHGELCDLCGCAALHPFNEDLRKKHNQECIEQHEKDMELSFAVARSREKTCGVCFEIVMEKADGEQRFGILPNCNHCFCLACIRRWRQARQFENNIIRACPECRVTSDFVCPSMYWVDTKEDKDKLILDYKKALSKKDCKYFKKGSGKCPFGNKCFYQHAFPDGRHCDVGPPPRQRRRRTAFDSDIEVLQQVILWDFLDGRDNPWHTLAEDIDDLVELFTDSEDSDWSDYELFTD